MAAQKDNIKVGVNGYGVIGKRVADAIARQHGQKMKIIFIDRRGIVTLMAGAKKQRGSDPPGHAATATSRHWLTACSQNFLKVSLDIKCRWTLK